MGTFIDQIAKFAPSWWQAPNMRTWLRATGSVFDELADRVADGRRASNPYSGQIAAPKILAAADNGAGLVRLTVDNALPLMHLRPKTIRVYSAVTSGGLVLNATWRPAFIDATHIDLVGSTFTGAYLTGAVVAFRGLRQCDESMLAMHAQERGIRLYDNEPELSKRFRLSQWRQLKRQRGSHRGELANLQPFWLSQPDSVLPWMRIFHKDNQATKASICHTISPAGVFTIQRVASRWNYDGQSTKRTRFWLVVYLPPGSSNPGHYDDGSVYDAGALYDDITTTLIADMVAAVLEAKAAHSRLAAIITTTMQPTDLVPGGGGAMPFNPLQSAVTLPDGSTTMPTGNWGSAIDPATNLPTRPAFGTWVYEDPI